MFPLSNTVRWLKKKWLRDLAARTAPRTIERPRRGPDRLGLERLEDRTLLSVSIVPGSGNAVGILGTVGDSVWLRTSASNLQYSTDGTNYSSLGVTVTQDVTVTLGALDAVHLGSSSGAQIIGQGHALTFQALGVPNGSVGQLAAPKDLSIDNTVATAGGNLSILNMQGIDVGANVTVSTRNIGTSTDYLHAASVGNSGSITLTSENPDTLNPILNVFFNNPHVNVGSGARVLAQVLATDPFKAGDVTVTAQNTNYSLGNASFSSISILARGASINLTGATVEGGNVNVSTTAGDQDLLGELSKLAGGNAAWATGFIENLLPLFSDVVSLPFSFLFKKADATVGLN